MVRRVRREEERARQRKLAQTLRDLLIWDDEFLRVQQEIDRASEEIKIMVRQAELDVLRLRQWELFRGRLKDNLEEIRGKKAELNRRLTTERGELLEAVKKRKALDRLYEKQWSRYQDELRREERTMTDEMANVEFLRLQAEAMQEIEA